MKYRPVLAWITVTTLALPAALAQVPAAARSAPAGSAASAAQPSAATADDRPGPASASTAPTVRVAEAKASPTATALRLPARVVAAEEVRIFARATGIVTERRVDLGDRVKAGDLLLRISAPEIDQSLQSARAALGQVQAREKLANLNLDRSKPLVEQNFLAPSNLDTLAANVEVARADTAAARSEVRRLEEVQRFQQVRAPFAGVITERAVERGDRVSADGGTATGHLFRLARLSELRVVIDVPQSSALGLRTGAVAKISFPEFAGETFNATLQRRSGAIDASTGSMRVELSLPNPDLRLPAGLRGEALIEAPAAGSVRVPAAALHMRDGKPHVATVDVESKLRFVPVSVARTSGPEAVISSGLAVGTRVVLGLNSLLREGGAVSVAP